MYPEGARELELKLENDFGRAAMHVACAYLFQQVFTYCCYLLQKRHSNMIESELLKFTQPPQIHGIRHSLLWIWVKPTLPTKMEEIGHVLSPF